MKYQTCFSIPASNAFVERVFSHMNVKWSDARNRCSVDLIKSELFVSVNLSSVSCRDFYEIAKNNKKLLKSVQSNEKYVK